MSDHYSTLGIDRNATDADIKKAYRRMASKYHPDKGGDTTKFQQIEEAYRTLSDPNSKSQYDNPQPQFNGGGFHGGFGGHPFEDLFRQFGHHPFGDIFGQQRRPQNRTLNVQTMISLEEAFYGKEMVANITLPNGKEQIVNVKIPAGINDGTALRLAGMGEDSVSGAPRGDIHLTVRVQEHPEFVRQGDDLVKDLTLPIWDAIIGNKIIIKTIDKKELEVTIQPGTQHDQVLAVQNAGMPNMNDNRFRGRLLLRLKFNIPNNLTDQQKSLITQAIK